MKIDTLKLKEAGKWFMAVGAALFTCGVGTYWVGDHIEKKEAKSEHVNIMHKLEEENYIKDESLKREKMESELEKDRLYAERLRTMDNEEFAKFHAERVAKANSDVINEANSIKTKAESDITKVRMECINEVTKIRKDCLEKVEEANRKRDEAVSNYESIEKLFRDKDKILEAKNDLEELLEKNKQAKDDREELIKSIKDLLD